MKFKCLFIILTFIISCKHENRKLDLAKSDYSKIKNENIEELLNVEFEIREDIELWTYFLNSDYDSTFVWTYDSKNGWFDLTTHPNYEKFKKKINEPSTFVKSLEDKKNRLGIKGISNSPWTGHFVKFWFSNSEVIIYQPDGFKIDSDAKQRWLDQLNKGIRFDKNWIYLDMDKNP
jgi:hypothetical protein